MGPRPGGQGRGPHLEGRDLAPPATPGEESAADQLRALGQVPTIIGMPVPRRPTLAALSLAGAIGLTLAGCKDEAPAPTVTRAPVTGDLSRASALEPAPAPGAPMETIRDKMPAPAPAAKVDGAKGDRQDASWVPAEFKAGMARWKDVGVYVDGKPMGFLSWGELPVALAPTWVKDKVSAEKRPGTDDPGFRWARQRFYRFTDYLTAIGVDVRTIKELHVYGPKLSQTNISTGADLRSPAAAGFMFRFGSNVGGKPIPQVPDEFGNGKTPDKISGVMVYIKKKPPRMVRNEGLELDGQMQVGVPYYGEPLRGGVRIYIDDRLAAIIKRQELDMKHAEPGPDGAPTWKLADVLAAQGADTRQAVELWVIRDERRAERLPAAALATLRFAASSQAKGGVILPGNLRANAIAIHTRALTPAELPQITADDEQ